MNYQNEFGQHIPRYEEAKSIVQSKKRPKSSGIYSKTPKTAQRKYEQIDQASLYSGLQMRHQREKYEKSLAGSRNSYARGPDSVLSRRSEDGLSKYSRVERYAPEGYFDMIGFPYQPIDQIQEMRKMAEDKKLKKHYKSAKKALKTEKAVSDITRKILDRNRIEQMPRFNEDLDYSQAGDKAQK